jgi:hypothetical protein
MTGLGALAVNRESAGSDPWEGPVGDRPSVDRAEVADVLAGLVAAAEAVRVMAVKPFYESERDRRTSRLLLEATAREAQLFLDLVSMIGIDGSRDDESASASAVAGRGDLPGSRFADEAAGGAESSAREVFGSWTVKRNGDVRISVYPKDVVLGFPVNENEGATGGVAGADDLVKGGLGVGVPATELERDRLGGDADGGHGDSSSVGGPQLESASPLAADRRGRHRRRRRFLFGAGRRRWFGGGS